MECYCMIRLYSTGILSKKIELRIDYGQGLEKDCDKSGKVIKYNSMVTALNRMAADDWQLVQATQFLDQKKNEMVLDYYFKKVL